MNQSQAIVYFLGLLSSLIGMKIGGQKLKTLSKSYLLHLLIRLTIFINLWMPAIFGAIAVFVYSQNKDKTLSHAAVITLLFYLFGKTPLFDLTISSLILLDLYNERAKRSAEKN